MVCLHKVDEFINQFPPFQRKCPEGYTSQSEEGSSSPPPPHYHDHPHPQQPAGGGEGAGPLPPPGGWDHLTDTPTAPIWTLVKVHHMQHEFRPQAVIKAGRYLHIFQLYSTRFLQNAKSLQAIKTKGLRRFHYWFGILSEQWSRTHLKGQCRAICSSPVFLFKQLLLVPVDMPRMRFNFFLYS